MFFIHTRLVLRAVGNKRNVLHFSVHSFLNGARSKIDQRWLLRQSRDIYVKDAKIHNFRCRSAFKLLQMDEKYHIMKPGHIVVDCGAAPGSWSQVAATKTNANKHDPKLPVGTVIGIDKLHIFPVEGVTFLPHMDFTSTEAQEKIMELLKGEKIDIVLSDMAPNASGLKLDHDYLIDLSYKVLRFAILNTKVKGTLLIKLWSGSGTTEYQNNVMRFYDSVRFVKPDASRKDSAELYILARGFKGAKLKSEDDSVNETATNETMN